MDWYFARVCLLLYELRFIIGGKSSKKVKDFLIDFQTREISDLEEASTGAQDLIQDLRRSSDKRAETAKAISKSFMGALGFNSKGEFVGKLKTNQPPIHPKNRGSDPERNNPVIVKKNKGR